ncbi:MAG: UbiA family prenyltransferase [Flavobacteriales bacterium]|nr:UbiA family prenyltransferase [Flavobacteriales bacterium]
MKKFLFFLQVSRPGLWFAALWLYLLPTSQIQSVWSNFEFWYGIFYVSFPLNFVVYGWNDIVDREIDKANKRKGNFWFGAKGMESQLSVLWKPIVWSQILFFTPLVFMSNWKVLLIFALFILVNALYNLPKNGLRSRPPLELIAQIGYLLIVPLSITLNETDPLPFLTYLYLFLFAMQSHLMGEVMDIEPDMQSGRKTTATQLGMSKTKVLIMAVVLSEIIIVGYYFKEFWFALFLSAALLWLILDLLVLFKTKMYTLAQMKLFAYASNGIAIASMIYVWWSGCLVHIP